jgi:hypothetical protein
MDYSIENKNEEDDDNDDVSLSHGLYCWICHIICLHFSFITVYQITSLKKVREFMNKRWIVV